MGSVKKNVKEQKEVDKFLCKVDEIDSLIRGLNSTSEEDQKSATQKADAYILKNKIKNEEKKETGFNKTIINTLPSSQPPAPAATDGPPDQAGFMAVMEQDANERAERRKINQKEAERLKDLGNIEFKNENFEKALEFYNEAMDKIRDNPVIYTNRAQAKIKLKMYQEAITDCDWALRINSNCIKAHVHIGRAHLGLKHYDKSREWFNKILSIDNKKQKMVEDYLADVDLEDTREKEEVKAKELFDAGDREAKSLIDIMGKVKKADQLPLYYSGGFRVISSLLTKECDKTLFRTEGGIQLILTHHTLHRCLTVSPLSLNREEIDLLEAAINMYSSACIDNDSNKSDILKLKDFTSGATHLLQAKLKSHGRNVKWACIKLLLVLSTSKIGQSLLVTQFDLSKLLTCIFHQIKFNSKTARTSAALLNNIALDNRFKSRIRDTIEDQVIPSFEALIKDNSCNLSVLPTCLTFMTNLSADKVIRSKLTNRPHLWQISYDILNSHKFNMADSISCETLTACVGLLCNLSNDECCNMDKFSLHICQHCLIFIQSELPVSSNLKTYSLKLMSHILPKCTEAVTWACNHEAHAVFMNYVKGEENDTITTSLKCLTSCTQLNDKARQYIVHQKGLGPLVKLLKHEDELVVGNSALCLSHCVQVPKAGAVLTKTDIIKDLLVLAQDAKNPDVKQNCAILLGKLAQCDKRHLEKLRELHGIEILNACMKYIK